MKASLNYLVWNHHAPQSSGTNPPGRMNKRTDDGPCVSSARDCWAMMCTIGIFQVFVTELKAAATFSPASHVLGITFALFVADWLFTFPQACCSATGELVNLSPLKVDILTISPLAEQLFPLSDLSVRRIWETWMVSLSTLCSPVVPSTPSRGEKRPIRSVTNTWNLRKWSRPTTRATHLLLQPFLLPPSFAPLFAPPLKNRIKTVATTKWIPYGPSTSSFWTNGRGAQSCTLSGYARTARVDNLDFPTICSKNWTPSTPLTRERLMYRKNCIGPLKFRRRLHIKWANILSPSKMQLGKRKGNCKTIGKKSSWGSKGHVFFFNFRAKFQGGSKGHVFFFLILGSCLFFSWLVSSMEAK